jgi:rhodanese-related sulfurtransferase
MMSDQIRMVDPGAVLAWHEAGETTIIDVREVPEYQAGHIPGAVLVPLSSFDAARVPHDPSRRLVVHCQSGIRCGPASAKLVEAGFKGEINRLAGGFKAWLAAGGPVERDC